jgi:hypothetical protein
VPFTENRKYLTVKILQKKKKIGLVLSQCSKVEQDKTKNL